MFGLFDSPTTKIKKHMPSTFHSEFDRVASIVLADIQMGNGKTNAFAHGFLMSVWAINFVTENADWINERDARYIQNMGMNCMNMLNEYSQTYIKNRLQHYMKNGTVPPTKL